MIKFVLGSSSPSRLKLLNQIGFIPDLIAPANIDETPLKKEKSLDYVKRVAESKVRNLHSKHYGNVILTADTIVATKSLILRKAHTDEEVRNSLDCISGKSIRVITSVCLINSDNKLSQKTVITNIKYKHFNNIDIEEYIKSKEGLNKAGGICIEGLMESFVIKIIGSYSNIMGLPLYETRNMLISAGIAIHETIYN
jgi:septum formation protein